MDRVIQQAIAQELTPIYEEQFSDNSFGFRPGRSAHDALGRCREYINEGYVYAVSMDLQSYFDRRCIYQNGKYMKWQTAEKGCGGRRLC